MPDTQPGYRSEETIAAFWWQSLQPTLADGSRNYNADPGVLARLRRASLTEAALEPATIELFRQLQYLNPDELTQVALCAGVLAHIRTDNRDGSAAGQMGSPRDRPTLHPARFNGLLAIDAEPEQRLADLRRAVAVLGGTINVRDIAAACLHWTERQARRWALEYADAFNHQPTGE
jgi:CRISPR system Cascade subunit CasB